MKLATIKWARTQRGTASEMHVLLLMATYANDDDLCWPSVATIEAQTGLKERTVRYLLRSLESQGLIEVASNHAGGRTRTRQYRLNTEAGVQDGDDATEHRSNGTPPPASAKGATGGRANGAAAEQRGQPTAGKGATDAKNIPSFAPESKGRLIEEESPPTPQGGSGGLSDFDRLKILYPRPGEEAAARRVFNRLVGQGKATAAELLQACAEQWEAGRFRADPMMNKSLADWLRLQRHDADALPEAYRVAKRAEILTQLAAQRHAEAMAMAA